MPSKKPQKSKPAPKPAYPEGWKHSMDLFNRPVPPKLEPIIRRNVRTEFDWLAKKIPKENNQIIRLATLFGFVWNSKLTCFVEVSKNKVPPSYWKALLKLRMIAEKK